MRWITCILYRQLVSVYEKYMIPTKQRFPSWVTICHAAMSYKKKLRLPRWLLEKCFEFFGYDCFGLKLLLLIDKIRRVLECCIYDH
jgi:hypothetical protein